MFNKLKKAVKYIVKKIKQGVEIVAEISKDIITGVSEVGKEVVSGTKDVVNTVGTTAVNRYADYMGKKIDLGKSICSTIHNDIKTACNIIANPHNRITAGVIGICLGVGLSVGFIITGVIDTKRTEV